MNNDRRESVDLDVGGHPKHTFDQGRLGAGSVPEKKPSASSNSSQPVPGRLPFVAHQQAPGGYRQTQDAMLNGRAQARARSHRTCDWIVVTASPSIPTEFGGGMPAARLRNSSRNPTGGPAFGTDRLRTPRLRRANPGLSMTPIITPATRRASFAIGNEQAAKRVVDLLNESFFEGQAAIAAFEGAGGRWEITVHFAEAPDEGSIREMVGLAAGDDIARDVAFDTVDAKDWVKATLEELVPVRAGRFVVHGRHDRARVPPNKLGIEIEAALAFGTGHHGTTRGCLLLLDEVLKATVRPRARSGHRHRGARHRGGEGAAHRGARERYRSALGARGGGKRETERYGRSGRDDPRHRLLGAEFAQRAPFDLVLANILANPLRQMATPMARHLAPSALVILSGLLPHQASPVVAAYRARGLIVVQQLNIEGWSSLLLRKAG